MAVYTFRVTVDDGGDQKTWDYGVDEIGPFEAKERMRQYLISEGMQFSKIEEAP